MSTMQLEPHNAVAAAEATATVETDVEGMDVDGPSDQPMLSMVEHAEDAERATQLAETRADTADAVVTQLTTQLAQLTTQLQDSRDEAAQRHAELDSHKHNKRCQSHLRVLLQKF